MARKKKQEACPAGEKWAVPYADFLSLLLALFIALWAISETNPSKIEALKTEFIKIFDFTLSQSVPEPIKEQDRHKSSSRQKKDKIDSLEQSSQKQEKTMEELQVSLEQSQKENVLNLPISLYFSRGSTDISSNKDKEFLKRVAQLCIVLPPQIEIEIRGFSDDSDTMLRSYDLAYARGMNVLKFFTDFGIEAKNINVKSYGQNEPKAKNNAEENNRVELYFKADKNDTKAQESILDLISKISKER